MKKKIFGAIAVGAMLLTSCSQAPTPQGLSEIPNATKSDSLSCYWGTVASVNFWRQSAQDTALLDEASKKAYLEGFQKALNMAEGDDAYLSGLMVGMQVAMTCNQFQKDYQVALDKNVIINSFAYAMQSDTTVDMSKFQGEMMPLLNRLEEEKSAREKAEADKLIEEEMKKLGYIKADNGVVHKIVAPGAGKQLERGEYVLASLKFTDLNGKTIVPMGSEPQTIIVGKYRFADIVNKVMPMMNVGAKYSVLASAVDAFGPQARQLRLNGNDIVCIEVDVKGYCNANGEKSEIAIKEEIKPASSKK